jgi:probable HAF family extracellular repeat protein
LGINNAGQVVGWSSGDSAFYAFLWTPHSPNATTGTVGAPPALPGHIDANYATAVNASGQVAGHSRTYSGGPEMTRAYVFTPSAPGAATGTVVDIGQLPGGTDETYTKGINDFGQVVGLSQTATGLHAFVWTPSTPNGSAGTMTDLGDLPGGQDFSEASAINGTGVVVGTSYSARGYQGFRWTPASPNAPEGTMQVLTPLGAAEGANGFAFGVNDAGWIVGRSESITTDDVMATLWTPDGTPYDLNSLVVEGGDGWELIEASAVSGLGHITGTAMIDLDPDPFRVSAVSRAFLLVPIPQPAAAMIIAPAAALILCRRRRVEHSQRGGDGVRHSRRFRPHTVRNAAVNC